MKTIRVRDVVLFALLATVQVACEHEQVRPADTVPPATSPEGSAYLIVSDLQPEAGRVVVIGGAVSIGAGISVGSYRVRLAYDSTLLTYLGERASPGTLRVVNPQPGEIIVAGASSETPGDGRLFMLRFRVEDRAGLNSLMLHVDELNDEGFVNQSTTVTRSSRLVLDLSLAPTPETSR